MPRHINLESGIRVDEEFDFCEGLPPTLELPVQNTFIQYPIDRFDTGILRPRFETAPEHPSRRAPSMSFDAMLNNSIRRAKDSALQTLTIEEKENIMLLRHKAVECKPCAFVHRPEGCQNGRACDYCHLCPPGELKRRKTRKRRNNNHGNHNNHNNQNNHNNNNNK